MNQYIDKYLESKKLAWAESTLRSEKHRLNGVAEALDGNPMRLWTALEGYKPYSKATVWVRVVDYFEWLKDEGLTNDNPYKAFKRKNARLFKHVYQPKTPTLSFEEALERIETLSPEYREKARQLILGGLRYTESFTLKDGVVIGKGSKPRRAYTNLQPDYVRSYRSLLRALSSVGLKPHMLRKICATALGRKGFEPADLCEVMGWSSYNTAKSYLAPLKQEALAATFKQLQGGNNGQTWNKAV